MRQDVDQSFQGLSDRSLAAWEIVSVTSSLLMAAWMIGPFAGGSKLILAIPLSLAFALMLLSHQARHESARTLGWRLDNFWPALRLLILPMLCAAVLIILAAWRTGSLRFDLNNLRLGFLLLPAWAFAQQYVLQAYINRRAQIIWGAGWPSVLLVALFFALMHLPNPWLTAATFAGGVVWAFVYQRAPNLLALSLSHSLMSLLLASVLPSSILGGLRVGFKFFGTN